MMRCALSIAGSDSIGGAGIQTDIKAMAAVGVHAHTVVTAITAQNTCSVKEIMPVPVGMVEAQFKTVMADSDVKAVKTGMLYSGEIAETVADLLEDRNMPFVADPVLIAGVGDVLSNDSDGLRRALKKRIVPLCDILTPNRYEAEVLSGITIRNEDDARTACELLGKEGTTIYLKGGHIDSRNVVDTLYNGAEFKRFEYPRLERAGHGGGCTLSAYITAHLAKGYDALNAIIRSREMIQESIATMYAVGKGNKIVNPMVPAQQDEARAVLSSLDKAADRLVRILPNEWVPKPATEFGYAAESPKDAAEVAAVQGGISSSGGVVKKNGNAKFGASPHTAKMILTAMAQDKRQRSAIGLAFAEDLVSTMEEVGMAGITAEGNGDVFRVISKAMKKHGSVPDAVFYRKGNGKGVFLLGKDPGDIVGKIDSIL
jgi:hydroxymethylpyrimidine/phosphomethylpyrimidine kinase